MNDNGWVKVFADGTFQEGGDKLVSMKLASWSRGRLTGMIGVQMFSDYLYLNLSGPGEYWQSDDYTCTFQLGESQSSLESRRIMKRVDATDKAIQIFGEGGPALEAAVESDTLSLRDGKVILLEPKHIGQWFVLQMNITTNTTEYYFAGERK